MELLLTFFCYEQQMWAIVDEIKKKQDSQNLNKKVNTRLRRLAEGFRKKIRRSRWTSLWWSFNPRWRRIWFRKSRWNRIAEFKYDYCTGWMETQELVRRWKFWRSRSRKWIKDILWKSNKDGCGSLIIPPGLVRAFPVKNDSMSSS